MKFNPNNFCIDDVFSKLSKSAKKIKAKKEKAKKPKTNILFSDGPKMVQTNEHITVELA